MLKDLVKNLLQIKKIIALLLTFVFCYLAIIGRITAEQYIPIFTMIVAFYFGQSATRQAIKENKE